MKNIVLVAVLVFAVFLFFNHQRLFLRDPLASLSVDGAKVPAQIYINYTNDVLVLRDDAQPLIVQNWDHTPGNTKVLPCLRLTACMIGADQAAKFPLGVKPEQVTMSNRVVSYTDEQGKAVRIVIR